MQSRWYVVGLLAMALLGLGCTTSQVRTVQTARKEKINDDD